MKNQEQTKSIVLTAEEIKTKGEHIVDIMSRIDMLKGYTNTLMMTTNSEPDKAIMLSCLQNYLFQAFTQLDAVYRELDNVAFPLLECDNKEELEAY